MLCEQHEAHDYRLSRSSRVTEDKMAKKNELKFRMQLDSSAFPSFAVPHESETKPHTDARLG